MRPADSFNGMPARSAAPWPSLLAGLVLGLGMVLFFFAPARWLAAAVSSSTEGRLRIVDAQGTIWSGSGQLSLHGGDGSSDESALAGRLRWDVQPAFGALAIEIQADCCTPKALAFRLMPDWGGAHLQLADRQSYWPAHLLAGLGTPWNTIRPEGQLLLQSQSFVVQWNQGRLSWSGQLQLDAMEMASRLSTLRPMGSYRLLLRGAPGPQLELSTLQGSLQLQGSGQWVRNKLRFEGQASAAPDREEALANLLNIIGQRNGARSIIKLG
jgi:general secretion pathway protein N